MLQQTRVETVIPYFHRFMARYPTIVKLAEAPLDEVLAAWAGLGYYRRARSLWNAAREVTARYGGELPRSRDELESLPGIGPYTAGAIASVAYEQEEALVDGNVARVLARLHAIEDPIDSREAIAAFWSHARDLVRGERPGDLNQALMELGATICIPGRPRCAECPVAAQCEARKSGAETRLPTPKKKRVTPILRFDAAVVTSGERVLLAKRPEDGLYAGMWEPPLFSENDALPVFLSCCFKGSVERRKAGGFRHVLTHRTMDIDVGLYVLPRAKKRIAPPKPYVEARWFDVEELQPGTDVALSRLARRSLEHARKLTRPDD